MIFADKRPVGRGAHQHHEDAGCSSGFSPGVRIRRSGGLTLARPMRESHFREKDNIGGSSGRRAAILRSNYLTQKACGSTTARSTPSWTRGAELGNRHRRLPAAFDGNRTIVLSLRW